MMSGTDGLIKYPWLYLICGSLIISGGIMIRVGEFRKNEAVALMIDNKITTSVKTVSSFTTEVVEKESSIPFGKEYIEDNQKDACSDEEVLQKGVAGKLTIVTEITYYDGEEYGRRQLESKRVEPVAEKVARGTKKVYKTLKTAEADINYSCALGKFSATAYDSSCHGCNATTAIGMKAGFGVVAVDPKVITLGTKLYVTGYGMAIAGDTGGAIKGRKIDLGFDKIDRSWGVRTVEVYVL